MKKIIVVGGGPAGMMAAGQASTPKTEVLLLEKMKRPGRKLGITGKGRCNLTNIADISDFLAHFGKTGPFLRQVFFQFFNNDLMEFLEDHGLELVSERGGRVFPKKGKATEVVTTFMNWLKRKGVAVKYSSTVNKISIADGKVDGVIINSEKITCDAVVLATGGASYPATGSTGDGYRLAASLGHEIVATRPALVPLVTCGKIAGRMDGLNLRNVRVQLFVNNKKQKEDFGELAFSKFGVMGPVILTLSGIAVDAIDNGDKIELSIDLKPALDDQKLEARILRDINKRGKEQMEVFLRGLLPREMVPVCLELTDIARDRLANTISKIERRRLRNWLKEFRLTVTGYRPIKEAIVTAGGVNTKSINPRTMESKLVEGLFIAGELLDIQADTGGYNLQAAFSTGYVAGCCAAKG